MDEKTQYNCDKIFTISNHIYNCIKNTISPSGIKVDYTSIKSIWISFIGIHITLSHKEFNDLNNKCKNIKSLLEKIEYVMSVIKYLNTSDSNQHINYINNNTGLFDIYFDEFNNMIDDISRDIHRLKSKTVTYSKIIPEKDNISRGTEWINKLFDVYLKYDGIKQVSTMEFFYHIKSIWDKIENYESIEIAYIMDDILGGNSMLHVSHNLLDWIKKNGDVIKIKYKDIIDVSLEPKIRKRDIIEFDPEAYNDCYVLISSNLKDLKLKV